MKRTLIIVGLLILLILGLSGAYCYTELYIPMQRFRDQAWLARATPQELRETAHKLLRSSALGLDPHDAIIHLQDVGDDTSVPLLIRALPRKNGPHACTWSHCMDTLRKLTGEPAEDWTFEDWHRWWDEKGRAKYDPD